MSKELSELEKTLQQTKKQFLATAKRATKELDHRRKALRKDIARANTRAKRARADLQKKSERLANTTATKAKRELKKQIRKLEKMLDGARGDAAKLRKDLGPVMDDLANARDHLSHALHVDRAMAKIRRQFSGKPKAKKKAKKKKVTKKKATKKKAKKKAAKKKVTKKKATRKKGAGSSQGREEKSTGS